MKPPALDILEILRCSRDPGEDLYVTARRLITQCLLWETGGNQREAADLAGVTPRRMNHYAGELGMRPMDERRAIVA